MKYLNIFTACLLLLYPLLSCQTDKVHESFITENVVIIVVDGPRNSECWDAGASSIAPNLHALKSQGVFFSNFTNDGDTRTVPGHAAITTGVYENLDNTGLDVPKNPSIFQCWSKRYEASENDAWIIASKDKLESLGNCTLHSWKDSYLPKTHCGVDGAGQLSGYQDDSLTVVQGLGILATHHPRMTLFNLREPDFSGHTGNWDAYIAGMMKSDEYVQQIIDFIESDPFYSGKTTIFITSDHGRHLDGVSGGFAHHGDECDGCRNMGLLVIGPDFEQGKVVSTPYNQIDISATIARLMKFTMSHGKGQSISELFE
jgi:Sulfatase/Type I phosphodiesterase / nucleotide pyrophosphatase